MAKEEVVERRKEKNLVSMIKAKLSDLRTGSITIIVLIGLAIIGSLFAKYMMKKIMAIDVVVIVSAVVLGIAGIIIICVLYVVIRWIGSAVNKWCKEKGF